MPTGPREDRARREPTTGMSRRQVLGWGAAFLPATLLWPHAAHGQRVSEAPLAPPDAIDDLEHRFWKDLLEDFPLEPGERHFDNAETGIPPLQTLDRMTRVARDVAAHADAPAREYIEKTRRTAARFWGADPEEMTFANGATDAMRRIAEALPLGPAAVVAISDEEPAASVLAWRALERRRRVRIKRFAIHQADRKRLTEPRRWLDDANVVVVSHVLPTTGELVPLADVCDEARRRNVWVVANGSHAAGMVALSLHDVGVDAYLASGSGWMLGPLGTALLYVRKDRLPQIALGHRAVPQNAGEDLLAGALGVQQAAELELEPPSATLTAGLGMSLEWLAGIGVNTVRDHAAKLALRIHSGLRGVGGIEILSSPDDIARCPIVTLRITRRPNQQVATWLFDNLNMRVHRVDTLGLNAVRASTHVVNRPDELDWFVEAMRTLA